MRHRLTCLALLAVAVVVGLVLLITAAATVYDVATVNPSATVPAPDAHGHEIATGDLVTRYESWGRHGPVLLLIPGFMESSFVWQQVGPLLGRQFRVYAPDVRGFGYTTHRGPYTLQADTVQMISFLRALHLDPAHASRPVVVGHSSGAAIAANLALNHRHLVRGLVLLDGDATPSGAGPDWVHRLIVDPYFTAVFRLLLGHPILLRRVWDTTCGSRCPNFSGSVAQGWTRPLEVPGAAAALHAIMRAPLIGLPASSLQQIDVPAAVMLGTADPTISVTRAQSIARWIHARVLATVPGARHLPMVSEPRLFTRRLDAVVGTLLADRA